MGLSPKSAAYIFHDGWIWLCKIWPEGTYMAFKLNVYLCSGYRCYCMSHRWIKIKYLLNFKLNLFNFCFTLFEIKLSNYLQPWRKHKILQHLYFMMYGLWLCKIWPEGTYIAFKLNIYLCSGYCGYCMSHVHLKNIYWI